MRVLQKDDGDEKRIEQLFSNTDQTKNSCDKNMQDIARLKEAMARQGTQITEYQQAVEKAQRKLKEDIEMGCKSTIDVAIAKIENKMKESCNIQEQKDRDILETVK